MITTSLSVRNRFPTLIRAIIILIFNIKMISAF